MVGNQTDPNPNAEQPAGGQDTAKWAAGLGAMGVAALLGVGGRGRGLVQAAHRYFPEWAGYLHSLPAPGFLSAPSRMLTRGEANIVSGGEHSPAMIRLLQQAGPPVGEQWQEAAQAGEKLLPTGVLRIAPDYFNALTGGKDIPGAVRLLGHELSHLQGGLESLSEDAPHLASNPSNRVLRTMAGQAYNRLSPDVEANMDTLMAGLANPKWKDLSRMYAAYREAEPGIPAVPPMEALSEVLAEIMGRNRALEALPQTDPSALQDIFRSGHKFHEQNPGEFQQSLQSLALRRLKPPSLG